MTFGQEEIFIEHSYALVSPNMSAAPQVVEAWGHKDRTDSEGRLLGQFVYEKVRTTRTSVLATTAAYC